MYASRLAQETISKKLPCANSLLSCTSSLRHYSSIPAEQEGSRGVYLVLTALLGTLGGTTWLLEAREIQKATAALEKGSKPAAELSFPADRALQRQNLQEQLRDLLKPYVCSMSHIDIVFGHEGTGKSEQIKEACRQLEGGTLYVDLQGGDRLGSHILAALTGERHRSLFQKIRDGLRGGEESHGVQILEKAAQAYLDKHERYPVIAIDHVEPKQCDLQNPDSPLLKLGRASSPTSPSMRPVIVLNDSQLETLCQEADASTSFRVVAMDDACEDDARTLLLRNGLPLELVKLVVKLVGGRLDHLQEAIRYWSQSSRWLSPMKPSASRQDIHEAHFAEIKKLVYWDLDKRLRIQAAISLWPSATGDAPVTYQKATDEDAERVLELLERVNEGPLPSAVVRRAIGEVRLLQLLKAQVLGYLPTEGPLHNLSKDLIGFGSPAMQQYFRERLQKSTVIALEDVAKAKRGASSWTHMIFG